MDEKGKRIKMYKFLVIKNSNEDVKNSIVNTVNNIIITIISIRGAPHLSK